VQALGQSKDDAVGNSPKMHRELAEGIGKDAVGAHWEFARTLPKVSGRSLGTRREITREDCETDRRECRKLSDCGSVVIKLDGHI
ncbi:hypothetical protein GW17_00060464, partial [Ensete ventricosum]